MRTTKTNIRLNSLELKNFKGVRSFVLNLNGESAVVYGENESGKSSLVDAFFYLLFEKNALDQSPLKFALQTLDENGEIIHHLEHSVIGHFSMEGKELTLDRTLTEKWTKSRGMDRSRRTGTETSYTFDGEPVTQTEFKGRMEEIAPENVMKMLTNIHYFSMIMSWQDRRKVLFDLAGEIKDEDIIASNLDLARYPKVLDGKSQESRVKILDKAKKGLQKDIKGIPERIDENTMKIAPVSKEDLEQAKGAEEIKTKAIEAIMEKIASLNSGGVVAEIRSKLTDLDTQEAQLKTTLMQESQSSTQEAREAVYEAKNVKSEAIEQVNDQIRNKGSEKSELLSEHATQKSVVEKQKSTIISIESTIKGWEAKEPEAEKEGDVCALCERPFEKGEEDTSYQDYVEQFNFEKAEAIKVANEKLDQAVIALEKGQKTLDELVAKGRSIAEEIAQLEEQRNELSAQHDLLIEKAQKALDELTGEQPKVEDSEEYASIQAKRKELGEKLENHKGEKEVQVQTLEGKKAELRAQLSQSREVLSRQKTNQELEERNEELRELLATKSRELDEVEADLQIIDDFIVEQARFVTEKVNSLFKHVSFKLFHVQENGGIKDTCEVLGKNGVGYNVGLNNAQQVQIGIEIIEVLGEHYGLSLPVFVDNRESVTELPETDLQVVSLVVSPGDKELRVEAVKEETLAL